MIQKTRAELKTEVKQLFKGRWKDAILLCIIISLLTIFGVMSDYSSRMRSGDPSSDGETFKQLGTFTGADLSLILAVVVGFLLVQLVVALVIQLFRIGTSYAMLDWVRQPEREIHPVSDSTIGFTKRYGWALVGLIIYKAILVFLWSLLLIVPGIIKAYAYTQTFYVYKDMLATTSAGQPRPRYRDAVTRSRQLMKGHKWQLFVLQLSFLGWALLSVLTAGIGQLWLTPYTYGVFANYYDNLQAIN
ncbi:DUF975 family protein [Lactiplantibacillus paraplantarum]|uniref:DUF975 family protein n=1 Tax=Lactiplantibacillus paraplantarum TaxID=60520 RepID=UPI0005134D48|nr:DUF975 family protein [Lactiplantibacillus paraplantarum]OAX74941.1 hypothetical protein A0U96_04120 [Lactiplantibacillus plantarum]ALO04207.1 hypothetical protein ASU28_07480 [Lactiplantibacillus paraplantarum]KGE74602.1 membrane protein [Lactiplantibacillus paraplantarum]MCW1910314.1 DUF975 family protein [Lactiplantibacillus paraplantarum]RDG13076.1 DUF975 family protein [Lactiplantibacillus paraplantarum]